MAVDPRPRLQRAARSLAIGAEVRSTAPEAPRRPSPEDLRFLARAAVRDAVRAEFAREGLDAVHLSADFRRADLQGAQLLTDREMLAFFDRTVAVIAVRTPLPGAREAAATARSAGARDAYGPTLEAASIQASFLLGAAERLTGIEGGQLEERVQEQTPALREAAREMLTELVTAPQELRAVMALRADVEGGAAPASTAPTQSVPAGTPRSAETADAPPRPDAADDPEPAERRSQRGERLRASDLRRALDHADAARSFLESEAGRATADLLRRGAAAVRERTARREERPGDGPHRSDQE